MSKCSPDTDDAPPSRLQIVRTVNVTSTDVATDAPPTAAQATETAPTAAQATETAPTAAQATAEVAAQATGPVPISNGAKWVPTHWLPIGGPGTYSKERGAMTLLLERKRVKKRDIDPKNEDPEVVARIRTWNHAFYDFCELNDYGGSEETHAEINQLDPPTPLKETDMLTQYFQYTLKNICGGGGNLYHLFSSGGGENRKTEPRREKLKILFDYIDESGLAKHLVIFKNFPYVWPLHYCDKKVNPSRFSIAHRLDILGVLDAISRDEYPWNVNHESPGTAQLELHAKHAKKKRKM